MTSSSSTALRLALQLAGPAAGDALAERLRPQVVAAVGERFHLPAEVVEALTARGEHGLRQAMTEDVAEFLERALGTGDPEIAHLLYVREKRRTPGFLSAILAAADPADGRWYAPDGLVPTVLETTAGLALEPALRAPFPELVAHAVLQLGRELPSAVVLDACRRLAAAGGPAEIEKLAKSIEETPDELAHKGLAGLLRIAAAAPDPVAALQDRRPSAAWTDPAHAHALLQVRLGERHVSQPAGLGPEAIREEHERRPFGPTPMDDGRWQRDTRDCLVRWESCPDDVIAEYHRVAPFSACNIAARLPFEVLIEPGASTERIAVPEVIGRGLRAGWFPAHRVLREVGPARETLAALPYDHEPTRRAVAELVAPLGTDPVNWLTFYARTGTARGTAAELVAEAAAPDSPAKRTTTWPRPLAAVFPATAPRDARKVFLRVLRCAPEAVQIAVVPHLDARAVQHFLVYGDPAPAVREAVVAAHGVPALVSYAAHRNLPAAALEFLLDLDEPAVDAHLFAYCHIDQRERERMLAGRLRGGGTRAAVPDDLLDALDEVNLAHYRAWLIAGLESGDLGVARKVVGRLKLQLPAARLRLLIAVWERGGPDAVRDILAMNRLPVTLRRQTEKLLDAPDGLARLRDRLAAEETPVELAAHRSDRLEAEGIPIPWPAMADALRAGALPEGAAAHLARHPDCPRDIQLEALRSTRAPAFRNDSNGDAWVRRGLASGALTVEDILAHAAPARAALNHLLLATSSSSPDGDGRAVGALITALTDEHLDGDVEAWAVCLQLLPTFAGTLPELISTAGAVARG
ncbi:hypothetical protein [Streptomyces gilvosporeus]|uniref:Uncharacterized protein n=1 Tax=Streptomyces gilvosporeus TaxID=553510 RepID=A0A1V0TR33_9ACTN|nr:hypothetical protein [Streptomyces gilvosporeus]ARF55280.1 hypothetical protein B1H19_14740 [Streptomyces gilvosporeus]